MVQNKNSDYVALNSHQNSTARGRSELLLQGGLSLRSRFGRYALGVVVTCAVTAINWLLSPFIGTTAVLLVYFLTIQILALVLTRGAIIVVACLCALFWNFLFLAPLYTLHIEQIVDSITFILFFAVALIAGDLTGRLRHQVHATHVREERLSFLYNFTSRMNQALDQVEMIAIAVKELREILSARSVLFLSEKNGLLQKIAEAGDSIALTERESMSATFASANQIATGKGTDAFGNIDILFMPVKTKGSVGVIGIRSEMPLDLDHTTLLETFISQLTIVLDRDYLLTITQQTKTNEQIDRLYNALLNLITHELRTPIAVIKGAVSSMNNKTILSNPADHARLSQEAELALNRLNRLIENLLDMSRIESGKMKLNLDWCDLSEIINNATKPLYAEFPDARIDIETREIVLLRVDFNLLEKVFYNLIRNSFIHNPKEKGLAVKVTLSRLKNVMRIVIEDNGRGLTAEQEQNPFTKFARGNESVEGMGIGLSVVKGILESHGGNIRLEKSSGAKFVIDFEISEENSRPFDIAT